MTRYLIEGKKKCPGEGENETEKEGGGKNQEV
jgi:hypothetical protein